MGLVLVVILREDSWNMLSSLDFDLKSQFFEFDGTDFLIPTFYVL